MVSLQGMILIKVNPCPLYYILDSFNQCVKTCFCWVLCCVSPTLVFKDFTSLVWLCKPSYFTCCDWKNSRWKIGLSDLLHCSVCIACFGCKLIQFREGPTLWQYCWRYQFVFLGSPNCVYMQNLDTLHDRQAFFQTVAR